MFRELGSVLGAAGAGDPLGGMLRLPDPAWTEHWTPPQAVPNPPPRTASDHETLLREMLRNTKPLVSPPPYFPPRTVRAEDAARWYDTLRVMTRVPPEGLVRGRGLKWRAPMRCIATYPPAPTFPEFCIAYDLTLALEDGGRWTPEL